VEIFGTARRVKVKSAMALFNRLCTLFVFLLAFAIPAYANNPPQPDGLFSLLLVFPVVLLACRLAGLNSPPKRSVMRIIVWTLVGVGSVVLLGAGTFIGAFAALLVLIYAIVRASHIMQKSESRKRPLIGLAVIAFALFAFVDYFVSIATYHKSTAVYEYIATMKIRQLNEAEQEFAKSGQSDAPKETIFGTIKDLEAARLIQSTVATGQTVDGYRFGEVLDAGRKHYVLYAIPAPELKLAETNPEVVPGASLLKALLGRKEQGTGRLSFAVDETGEIRQAVRTATGPVTREEFSHWEKLR